MMALDLLLKHINTIVEQPDFQKKIIETVNLNVSQIKKTGDDKFDHSLILSKLRDAGVIETILNAIDPPQKHNIATKSISPGFIETKTCKNAASLEIKLLRAKAFLDNLINDERETEESCEKKEIVFYACLHRQRQRTKGISGSTNFGINQSFIFNLDTVIAPTSRPLNPERLLGDQPTDCLLHLICIQFTNDGRRHLVSSSFLDWKKYFFSSPQHSSGCSSWFKGTSIELASTASSPKVIAGILDVEFRLLWPQDESNAVELPAPPFPPANLMEAHFTLTSSNEAEKYRSFTIYSRKWWSELLRLRQGALKSRSFRLFALDENGTSHFVCKFVHPLSGHRLLNSVDMATRFVASIPCEQWSSVGANHQDVWCSGLTLVSRNRGDVSDHANLLCSLLLGFGLTAYTVIGLKNRLASMKSTKTSSDKPNMTNYAWVMVLEPGKWNTFVIIDPVTGRRFFNHPQNEKKLNKVISPTDHVDCLYNDQEFYANIQTSSQFLSTSFKLQDDKAWKQFSREVIALVKTTNISIALHCLEPPLPNLIPRSKMLEHQVRREASSWRRMQLRLEARSDHQVETHTPWDEKLCCLLGPLIDQFEKKEMEDCSDDREAATTSNFDFAGSAIRAYVPEGYTFKAFPIQLLHTNASRALVSALKQPLCRDILTCIGVDTRLGLRACIHSLAEETATVWLVFACVYQST